MDRKLLLETTRKRVCESGKSSSKMFGGNNPEPKRKKVNQDYELQDKIKDLNDQIGFKEKRREAANNVRNYKDYEKLTEQMSELKSQKRKLDLELQLLTNKQKKSIKLVF